MELKLLDESDIKPSERPSPARIEKPIKIKIVRKENVRSCERVKKGMMSSCAICQELNKEFFSRCKNKWNYNE